MNWGVLRYLQFVSPPTTAAPLTTLQPPTTVLSGQESVGFPKTEAKGGAIYNSQCDSFNSCTLFL